MKTLITTLCIAVAIFANANVIRNGNTFSIKNTKDTLVTKYKFSDSRGNTYPIIIIKQMVGVMYGRKAKRQEKCINTIFLVKMLR